MESSCHIFNNCLKVTNQRTNAGVLNHLLKMEAGDQTHTLRRYETFNLECPEGIEEILKVLLDDGIDVNNPSDTFAAATSSLPKSILEKLLALNADVNSKYQDGEYSIHTAVRVNSKTKFEMIATSGDVLSSQWRGLQPLEKMISHYPDGNIIKVLNQYTDKMDEDALLSMAA